MTNYQPWIFGFSIVQFICNFFLSLYLIRKDKEKVTNTRFKEIEDRVTKNEVRITEVETKVERMPVCGNHDRMEKNDVKLFQRFDALHGDIRELAGSVKGLTGAVAMINDHLINGRK